MARVPPSSHRLEHSHRHVSRTQPRTATRRLGTSAEPFTPLAQSACVRIARKPPLPARSARTRRPCPRLGTLSGWQGRVSTSAHARSPTHAHARTRRGAPGRNSGPSDSPGRGRRVRLFAPRPGGQVCKRLRRGQPFSFFFKLFMLRLREPFCHTSSTRSTLPLVSN